MRPRGTKTTYNVHEAKTHLSRLLERVREGDEVTIAKAGVPVARLVPVVRPLEARPLGTERGRLRFGEDFDALLPAELLALFDK